ncbi:MAG: biotin attachment protein, partial [Lentisphaerae bacterium]|nr:biotin attachment protein [Lentisphaerota bacterium]
FQSLYFYCNEDAFDMMDQFRQAAGPDADLQTLSRGVNVVGLDSQPSDVIEMHARLFKKHGITTIRNFDALNDVQNLIYSGQCIRDAGLKHQVCVTMMELPPGCSGAHDPEFYERTLRQILDAEIPFDSVCFKDASGTAVPASVYATLKRARKMLPEGTLLHYHTHETAGIGVAAYMAALEAGADSIDLSMAPVSGGTCQTDVAVMWHALRGSNFDLGIDIDRIMQAEEVFKECMQDYFMPPEALKVEPMIPWSPMPGGALTANTQMLRDNGIMDKYPAIIAAMREVVKLGGFGTSVTPVSQFYFQQAFNNVMFGPWKKIAEGYGKMVLGYFGRTPTPPDPEVIRLASEQLKLEPTKLSPMEIDNRNPKKGLKAARERLIAAGVAESDENLFIAAACEDKGVAFLKGEAKVMVRKDARAKKPAASAAAGPASYTVSVAGRDYTVLLENGQAVVDGKSYEFKVREGGEPTKAVPQDKSQATTADAKSVKAPMPGAVARVNCQIGQHVEAGAILLVLEAMKMEIEVKAPVAGTVSAIAVSKGTQVTAGHVLLYIN